MTHGHSEIDVAPQRHRPLPPAPARREHTRLRTTEAFIKTYGIVHPGRAVRVRPRPAARRRCTTSQQKLGAVFFETAGWERPFWYESNAGLLERVRRRGDAARARVGLPLVEPDHQRRAPRDARARRHRRPVGVRDLRHRGPGRARRRAAHLRRAVRRRRRQGHLHAGARRQGRLPLRPHRDAARRRPLPGGHRRRARHGRPQVVHRPAARRRRRPRRPTSPTTSPRSGCGARGPATSSARSPPPTSRDEGFGFAHLPRASRSGGVDGARLADLLRRRARLGALRRRWSDGAPAVGRCCSRPGGRTAPCRSASASTAPPAGIEKGYRAYGSELDAERTIVEAGMQRPKVKAADFVGREAYLAQREAAPQTVLCTLTVDDHTSASGVKRYMLGGEPILTRDGGTLTDGHGHHPYVTTAGSAPSLGKHVLMAYLPPDAGRRSATQLAVSYMEELYPVTVGSVDATPLFDPDQRADAADGSMTDVLVCVKRVPDSSGEVVLTDDAQAVDGRYAGFTISAARGVRRRARHPGRRRRPAGQATVLTLGDDGRRRAAARRAGRRLHRGDALVEADAVDASARPTSPARSPRWSGRTRPTGTRYDLVLLGNDAADTGDFQVGIRLAYAARPAGRQRRRDRLEVADGVVDRAGRRARTAPRPTEVPLPAVVTVLRGRRRAALPDVPGRMKAKKVPDRGAHAAAPSRRGRPGAAARCRRRRRARSDPRRGPRRPRAAVVDLFEKLGVLPDDPGAGRDRRRDGAAVEVSLETLTFARTLSAERRRRAGRRRRRRRPARAGALAAAARRRTASRDGPPRRRRRRSRRTPAPAWAAAVAGRARRPPGRWSSWPPAPPAATRCWPTSAARLGVPMAANVVGLRRPRRRSSVTRQVVGGSALEEMRARRAPGASSPSPATPSRPSAGGEPGAAERRRARPRSPRPTWSRAWCRASEPAADQSGGLKSARVVVGAGRGAGGPDGFGDRARSWPSCSAARSASRAWSPASAGARTTSRSARPAAGSPRTLYIAVRHQRRHPALGRLRVCQDHPRDQHRRRGADGDQGDVRRDRRHARGRAGDQRGAEAPPRLSPGSVVVHETPRCRPPRWGISWTTIPPRRPGEA